MCSHSVSIQREDSGSFRIFPLVNFKSSSEMYELLCVVHAMKDFAFWLFLECVRNQSRGTVYMHGASIQTFGKHLERGIATSFLLRMFTDCLPRAKFGKQQNVKSLSQVTWN